MNRTKLPIPTEDEECILLVDYLNTLLTQKRILTYTHVPNETFTKSWSVKRKNKRMGVRGGFPDYVILTKKHPVFIEMKRIKLSVVSPEQKAWHEHMTTVGLNVHVCKGFDEARKVVEANL